MMDWLRNRFFNAGSAKPATRRVDPNVPFVINMFDDHVVVHRPDAQREEISWDALERVVVRVSDRAPWAGTAWLILAGDAASQQGCVVPLDAANHDSLVERLQALPDFNQQKLDNAMRDAAAGKSRSDAILWKRAAASTEAATPAPGAREEPSHDSAGQH